MEKLHTVMIVDDNADDRYSFKRYLARTDLSLVILEAKSGSEGIELLTSPIEVLNKKYPGVNAPTTLFLDINMPLMNGWELVEELERRQDEITLSPIKILMYSSSNSEYDKKKSKEYASIASYMHKGDSSPEYFKRMILGLQSSDCVSAAHSLYN